MSRKVVVTGATGLLGRQILKGFSDFGWEVIGVGLNRASPPILKLDLNNSDYVTEMITQIKPSVVIHCKFYMNSNLIILETLTIVVGAANRFPDQCESDKVGTHSLNTTASSNLAQICAAHDIFFLYISTDYVFSGSPGEAPYEIDSKTNPINFYGETKLRGEEAVLEMYEKAGKKGWAVSLRVPVLYGETSSNKESAVNVLMDILLQAKKEKKNIPMDHWSIRYPTNTKDVARVCQDVVSKYFSMKEKSLLPNILHFSSNESFTKYEICQLFSKIMDLPFDNINPNTKGNDPGVKPRPYNCQLSTQASKDLVIDISTVKFEKWWRCEAKSL